MDTTITIKPGAVKPIVNKHFDQISEIQWSLLASGICEPEVELILTDMLCEIIQTIASSALSIVLPMFQERLRTNTSQDEINTALEYVNTQLGESLIDSFAEVLHVSPEKSESVDKLTELVEEEVSRKVATAVSLAINSPTIPESSSIFISGTMCCGTSLYQMVTHVIECLRRFMNKMTSSCMRCLRSNTPESETLTLESEMKSSQRMKSKISVLSEQCESSGTMTSKVSVPSARCESSQSRISKISVPSATCESSQSRTSKISVPLATCESSQSRTSKTSVPSARRESSQSRTSKTSVPSARRESSQSRTSKTSVPSARSKSSQSRTSKTSVPSVKCESPLSMKSKVSLLSVTQAVAEILDKWSTEQVSSVSQGPSPSLDACDAAFEIVRIVSNDLHYSDRDDDSDKKSSSSKHHFNLRLILNKVKEFFACRATLSKDTSDESPEERKCRFLKFSKKQFQKMESELKMSLEKEDLAFGVPLSQDSGSSQPTQKVASDESSDLPGADSGSPRPKSEAGIQTGMVPLISLQEKLPSSIEFDSIKSTVETLFDISTQPEKSKPQAKESLRSLAKQLSKDLTDKIYGHVAVVGIDQIPSNPLRRSVSDPIIVRLGERVSPTLFYPSLQSRHVIIEDSVGKFLQQMCHWVEKEQSNRTSHSEKVSGALGDIRDLIEETVTPPKDAVPETLEACDSQTRTPSRSAPVTLCSDDSVKDSQSRATSCSTLDSRLGDDSLKSVTGLSPLAAHCSSRVSERTTNNIITALLMRLVMTEAPRQVRKSSQAKDIETIIERLSEVARENINISDSDVRKTRNNMTKINMAVIKDLKKEFGSCKMILEASMAENNPAFDRAVIKCLKTHLDDLYRPKRSAFTRFFIRVGKALTKPFRCCFSDCSDD